MRLLMVGTSAETEKLLRRLTLKAGHSMTWLGDGELPRPPIDYDLVLVEAGVDRADLLAAVYQIQARAPHTPILSLGWLDRDKRPARRAHVCGVMKSADGSFISHCQMRQDAIAPVQDFLRDLEAPGTPFTFVYQG